MGLPEIQKIRDDYKSHFDKIEMFGNHRIFLGTPFYIILNSCRKESIEFYDFLLSTIKYISYMSDDETPELEDVLELLENVNISPVNSADIFKSELSHFNADIKKYDPNADINIEGCREPLIMCYKFYFCWHNWSLIGESESYFLALHWGTSE